MNRNLLGAIIVIVVVVGAIFLFNNNAGAPADETNNESQTVTPTPSPNTSTEPQPTPTQTPNQTPPPASTAPKTVEISMTDSGYTPSQVTINKGDTVKFTNNGTKPNWPASAPHPTHTDYPAFDPLKGIAVGDSWSFTFDQTGRWPFHDHLNPTRYGAVTVQ